MKTVRKSKLAQALIVITVFGLVTANTSVANAVTKKTIKCYKGKIVKKVTAVSPKCPIGYTTKKPVVKITPKPTATPAKTTAGTVAFAGTFKGKMSILWSDSDVRATSVTAAGTGNVLGLNELTGTGSAAPQNQCDAFDGTGVLSGGGNTLKVAFDSSAKACAADDAAPTTITITGNAIVTGGSGKYAGATGTLKVTGTFAIKSKDAGFSESAALTLTLTGNITTK
ncbi:MAG: hypothetical protein Q8K86_01930 [Candidatus Nanopelagicaceae bacterium]|nr:hypothetical protein [Candidatus Nanopelagicaceae bacterium]